MAFINLSQLTKAVKGLINKINLESNVTNSKIGQLSNLDTTNKDNLVAAVNEVKSSAITSETDPTVPAWAKAASKPSYTAAEVGALPSTTVIPQIDSTLAQQGKAADAKATGDALNEKQPKPYTFGVFHDTNSDADPEYEVQRAPSTVPELLQLIHSGTSVSLEISNMDLLEATYINGEIYPLGANTIGVLFKRMEPAVDIQTIAMTGANANAVGLVGIYSGSVDSNITWQFYDLGNMPLATKAEVPTNVSDLTNDAGFVNASGAAVAAPVQSVNGQTGTVSLTIPSSASDVGALPDTTLYAGAGTAGGPATVANGIHYAHVDSTSTSTVYTATVTGVTQLYDGLTILLKNGVVTSASGFTININGLGAKPVYNSMAAAGRETTIFNINYTLLLIYDSTRVDGGCWINYRGYYSDSNTIPTGYCTTAAGTAAKSATCNYGYRDDDTYFPCLFRYANTAANATLAIASYATTAAPIYVNGARTSSSNTFGRGVILFLYHNGSYYCYNDGRFPVLVDGSVTSVQEYVATKYTKPSGGIPKTDLASAVQTSLGKADTALQSAPVTSVNNQTGAVVLTASDVGAGTYSKPSGGIPKTDLESAVQTSLGKADTALQSAPVTSVNNQTGAVTIPALPAVTASDNGKVMMVVDGAWAAGDLPVYNGEIVTPAYNVTISLTNPVNSGNFNSAWVNTWDGPGTIEGNELGRFQSPAGTISVSVDGVYGIAFYVDGTSPNVDSSMATCSGGVSFTENVDGGLAFQVTGDGSIVIDGIDYND